MLTGSVVGDGEYQALLELLETHGMPAGTEPDPVAAEGGIQLQV